MRLVQSLVRARSKTPIDDPRSFAWRIRDQLGISDATAAKEGREIRTEIAYLVLSSERQPDSRNGNGPHPLRRGAAGVTAGLKARKKVRRDREPNIVDDKIALGAVSAHYRLRAIVVCVASTSLRSPSYKLRRSRRNDRINVTVIMRDGYFFLPNTESMGN